MALTVLHSILVLLFTASGHSLVNAQSTVPGAENATRTAEILDAIDQLVEQNRRLEKQNQELLEQINALRQALAAHAVPSTEADSPGRKTLSATASETSAPLSMPASPGQPPADQPKPPNPSGASGTRQAGSDKQGERYDPQASSGSPAMFGEWNPGEGFTVARTRWGQLDLSGYMVTRYLNQLPPEQSATDHLGRPIRVQARQDFQFHRVLLYTKGWLFSPKFNYTTVIWTVNDTTQVAVGGALYYVLNKHFTLGAGYTALPGTQSMHGSHPYWPTYDRVMADEFFRPFYTQGIFGTGEVAPRLVYRFVVGNNLSLLGITANQLSRDLSTGGSLTWQPTTGEFGPRGAFGDYENHERLATQFNVAYTRSREPRFSPQGEAAANTTLRLADSLNVFDTGAFANGVTVSKVTYQMASSAAGIKYRGFWLQGEGYARRLDDFVADGPLPISVVRDFGFYVQAAYMVVPKTVELYGATSYIFSKYGNPKELIVGVNYYPWDTRNIRMNLHVVNIARSPVSSTFGFYNAQLTGPIVAIGMTAFY
jgi:hypothetical protein